MKVKRMRCCMCPNINKDDIACPGIEGTPHPESSRCGFVKTFIDNRGWMYKVGSRIGSDAFKAKYKKPDKASWKCHGQVPWQDSFDKAQEDLNAYANKKGWMVYE